MVSGEVKHTFLDLHLVEIITHLVPLFNILGKVKP